MRVWILIGFSCLLLLAGCASAPKGSSGATNASAVTGAGGFGLRSGKRDAIRQTGVDDRRFVSLLNGYRASHGLPALRVNGKLNRAAADMSHLTAKKEKLRISAHSRRGIARRLGKVRYTNVAAAENLYRGNLQSDVAVALRAWQNSPGHNRNLLNPHVTEIGLARVDRIGAHQRAYWTLKMARPTW